MTKIPKNLYPNNLYKPFFYTGKILFWNILISNIKKNVLVVPFKKYIYSYVSVLCTYPIKVGRSTSCDIAIKSENIPATFVINSISKEHFVLMKDFENTLVYLTNVSKNGTWVDGAKLHKGDKTELKDGSKIGFGPTISNGKTCLLTHHIIKQNRG